MTFDARPEGQPGTIIGPSVFIGPLTYPAVRTDDGTVWHWRDSEARAGSWIIAPKGIAADFTPGPEWEASCTHEGLVPWRGCMTEDECLANRRDDARADAAERGRS